MKCMLRWSLMLALLAGGALHGTADEPGSLSALKARFEARYPALKQLKAGGFVGETAAGWVAAVQERYMQDTNVAQVVDQENADRRTLYDLLARQEGVSAQVVALRNAARNFAKAVAGEYLQDASGSWNRKP